RLQARARSCRAFKREQTRIGAFVGERAHHQDEVLNKLEAGGGIPHEFRFDRARANKGQFFATASNAPKRHGIKCAARFFGPGDGVIEGLAKSSAKGREIGSRLKSKTLCG